jgi:excisionase family DNA binding protein
VGAFNLSRFNPIAAGGNMITDPSRLKIDENTKLLTVEEAAKIAHVSPSTIRNWANGRLPVFRYGRVVRIDQSMLFSFISQFMSNDSQARE